MNKIRSIYELKNCMLVNKFNKEKTDKKSIIVVEYADNSRGVLDLDENRDITALLMNIDVALKTKSTKLNIIFKDETLYP